LPVVTVPAGHTADGLPIGIQIAGRPQAEEMVLAVAEIVEQALSS
jgi:Asp-tRNA(Asn)/Glu-tRNA(Gln) amidotransferase A subunit family amidase